MFKLLKQEKFVLLLNKIHLHINKTTYLRNSISIASRWGVRIDNRALRLLFYWSSLTHEHDDSWHIVYVHIYIYKDY